MTEERVTPLRQRMIEDMRIRGMGDKHQKSHIRAIKDFAAFLGRSPDTAMPEDLRAYQLHMTDTGITPSTFNTRIVALRFFFGMTCGREEMKRYMQFRTEPRKLPVVFSVDEVSDILMAAPGPGLKYRAALSISYGAGLRAAEVCNLKVGDIVPEARLRHRAGGASSTRQRSDADPHRTGQGPEGPQGDVVARIARAAARLVARGASRRLAVSRQAEDQPDLTAPTEPRLHLGQAHGRGQKARDPAHASPQLRHSPSGGEHRRAGLQVLLGHAKLTTTARYTHVAPKTIRDTVSPYEMLAKLQDQTVKRSLE